MGRRTKIALLCVPLAIALGGALAFVPLVRHEAQSRALKRGLQVEIASVRPGWGRIWLEGVSVRSAAAPNVQIALGCVEVRLKGRRPTAVLVHGGAVELAGSAAVVADELRALRGARPESTGAPGDALSLSVDGLFVSWRPDEAHRVDAWGVSYSRQAEVEAVATDLVQGDFMLPVVATDLAIELVRGAGVRQLSKLSASGLRTSWSLDASSSASPAAATAEALPRGERWRARLASGAMSIAAVVPEGATVDLNGLEISLIRNQRPLRIGPGRLSVQRSAEQLTIELLPGGSGQRSPLAVKASIPLAASADVSGSVSGGPVSLQWLGVREGEWGLTSVGAAQLTAKLELTLKDGGKALDFSGSLGVADVAFEKAWLAPQAVHGLRAGLDGSGTVQLDGSLVKVDDVDVSVGDVHATISAQLTRDNEAFTFSGRASVPLASCQSLLDAAPTGLAPLLSGMRASGTFSAEGDVALDSLHPERMKLRWNVANECRITATPPSVSPGQFKRPFALTVLAASGAPAVFQTGPGSPNWVPRGSISRHVETAVLICEDGRFWRHRGFDEEAIHNSILENVKQRRFVRGASTISMQLAKNVYLKREKTLSRKLQEAVLTMLLEQEFTKAQLLELYLNVIEYAPGVYGIGPAAQYYFNTHASQLSLGQALYIGSVLSNPKKQHFGPGGQVTAGWMGYLRKLMKLGNRIHLVSDAELEDGLREQVTFKMPYSPRLPSEADQLATAAAAALAGDAGALDAQTPDETIDDVE